MLGFGVMFARLLSALRAAWRSPVFRGTTLTLLLVWAGATLFYAGEEHWSVLDALYFAVCTGMTIGYGDLAPTTALAKVFTVVYGLLSVGLFAALATQLARAFVNTQVNRANHLKDHRAHRRQQ